MAKTRVVVLGAGFGGLEVCSRLSDAAADTLDITLIDKSDAFVFGFAKLDVMFGRAEPSHVRHPYRNLHKPSVAFRQERVTSIDPVARQVVTDGGRYEADVLVVALGADLDPPGTPGLTEGGYEFYSPEGAARLRPVLEDFRGGQVVVGVAGTPFKCPPAPSETALLIDDYLTRRGLRSQSAITIVSPLSPPVPPSPATSAALLSAFDERGISYLGGHTVAALDPARRTATVQGGGEIDYDLFLGVPLHRAPEVVVEAGLTEGGWVAVDPYRLTTKYPGVYAIGDVANAPVPRAGVFAERAARVVADEILAEQRGTSTEPYDGYGMCYIEFGRDEVARVEMTFITANGPQGGPFIPPSLDVAREKKEFGPTRLRRWFGNRVAGTGAG